MKPDQANPLWKLAVVAAWVLCAVLVAGATVTVIGMVVLGPLVMLMGGAIMARVYRRAFEPTHCPNCHVAMTPSRGATRDENTARPWGREFAHEAV